MALTVWESALFLPFVLPLCLWVALSDLKHMKIRNKAVLALAAVFLVGGLLAVPLADYPWRVAQMLGVLVAGFIANALRLLGAGDAKFAAAMAPFVPAADARLFLMLLAVAMLAAFLTHRAFRAMPRFRALTADWAS
ncbi:MAG: hypothetical protein D6811_09730, partial [Alphaproteobacteria bacterium]